jgi:hypothetical protein
MSVPEDRSVFWFYQLITVDQDRIQRWGPVVVGELDYSVCQATDIPVTELAYVWNVDEGRFYVPDDQRVRTLGAVAAATHNTELSVNYAVTEVLQYQCKH